MQLGVVGAGYVGLVTAAGLASIGHKVRVGEANSERLAALSVARAPFFEPGLEELLAQGSAAGRLDFSPDNREAVRGAEAVFLTLPTPPRPDGSSDTTIVEWVLDEVATVLEPGALLILKSTVPVGSVRKFQERLDELGAQATVVSNPEFLREGRAVEDFLHPDRIVVGATDPQPVQVMTEIYRPLHAPLLVTDPVSAEMIKYASNAYLASRITFANAVANLCEALGADARDVLQGMGSDHRIGPLFLEPGPGFGGSCFPKDTRALIAISEAAGYDFALLKGVIEVNEEQRRRVLAKVRAAAGGGLAGTNVGLWGLAFKAGTDDIRESPALHLAYLLRAEGALVRAYDPQVNGSVDGIARADDPIGAAREAEVLLIATEWPEFRTVDLSALREVMRRPAIVDARNVLDPGEARRLGFEYSGIGR